MLFVAGLIAFGTWAAFCYLQPQSVPVAELIGTIKTFLVGAGSAALALYQPPKDPPSGGV